MPCAEDGVQGPPTIRKLKAEEIGEMPQRTRDTLASNSISEKRFLAETPSQLAQLPALRATGPTKLPFVHHDVDRQ